MIITIFVVSINKKPVEHTFSEVTKKMKKKDLHLVLVIRVAIIKRITRNWLKKISQL